MKQKKRPIDVAYIIVTAIVLSLFAFAILFILFWGMLNSFKTQLDFIFNAFGLPKEWTLEAYGKVWQNMTLSREAANGNVIKYNIIGFFENSLIYAFGCTVVKVFTTSLMAYLCARYKKYATARFTVQLVIICMIVPVVGTTPSLIMVLDGMGLFGSVLGVYFTQFSFLGMHFLIYYGIYSSIPMEYSEAAFIDGASHWYVMTKVIMPLVTTTTSVLLVLNFVTYWNDYQTPLIFWASKPTISVGLLAYVTNPLNAAFPDKMAADTLTAIPLFVLFLIFKKKMLGSMTVGGLKG